MRMRIGNWNSAVQNNCAGFDKRAGCFFSRNIKLMELEVLGSFVDFVNASSGFMKLILFINDILNFCQNVQSGHDGCLG